MSDYQEIVTKAVIGKGKKMMQENLVLNASNSPSKLLGCWIINNQYKAFYEDNNVYLEGSYEIHIWYAFTDDTDTDIVKHRHEYRDQIPFRMKKGEELSAKNELKPYCPLYPTCTNMALQSHNINVVIDREFIVDAIGEAIIKVQVSQLIQDEWDIEDEIENNINVDYINKEGK